MNILLIGFGKTGQEIAKQLNKDKHKIFFISPSKKESKFTQVSLDKTPENIDCILITLSTLPHQERVKLNFKVENVYDLIQAELKGNIKSINQYIPFLITIKYKFIIVVSNPMDEIVNYLLTKLPNKEIFGFGMQLDVKRFSKSLNKEIDCIGIHNSAIPLIDENSDEKYDLLLNQVDTHLLKFLRLNLMTHKITGKEFANFFEKLTSEKEEIIYVSHYLKQSFCEIKKTAISLPFVIKDAKILGVKQIKLNNLEKERLVRSVKLLKENVSGLN
jgi:malate/lactate dehydrogenase